MSRSLGLSPDIIQYLSRANRPEHPAAARCRLDTAAMGRLAGMQISSEQGAFLQLLVRLIRAKRALEVGVFTGYSALVTALALRENHGGEARLTACDISPEFLRQARGYWAQAGVEDIIETRLGPALASLDALIAEGRADSFDFIFVDADKTGYCDYYERCLTLLGPLGVMAFDNVLWSGAVADPARDDADTQALRALATTARDDPRVDIAMTSVGDGVLLVVKR